MTATLKTMKELRKKRLDMLPALCVGRTADESITTALATIATKGVPYLW